MRLGVVVVGALTVAGGVHKRPAWGPHLAGSMQSHGCVGSSRLWELHLFIWTESFALGLWAGRWEERGWRERLTGCRLG